MSSHEPHGSTSQEGGIPLLASLVLIGAFALVLVVLVSGLSPQPVEVAQATVEVTVEVTPEVTEVVVETPASSGGAETVAVSAPVYTEDFIAAGRQNYVGVCSACHSMDLRGVLGLGKSLIDSEFALGMTDEELVAFVIVGRMPWDPGNTTGVAMPARGNGMLSDEQLAQVVAYIRTEQAAAGHIPVPYQGAAGAAGEAQAAPTEVTVEPTATPTIEPTATPTTAPTEVVAEVTAEATEAAVVEPTEAPATEVPATEVAADATEEAVAAVDPNAVGLNGAAPVPVSDAQLFALWCAGCHTDDGAESGNQASLLSESDIVQSGDDAALYDLLTAPNSFPNTGEFVHPVFGDFTAMTEAQIRALVDYVQALPAGS